MKRHRWRRRFKRNDVAFFSSLILCLTIVAFATSQSVHNESDKVKPQEHGVKAREGKDNTSYKYSIIFGGLTFSAQSLSNQSTGEAQAEQQRGEEEGTEYLPRIRGVRLKITDAILALFTTLLFFATLWLFFATDELAAGAEETAKRQLRAYINIDGGSCEQTSIPGPAFINFKNFGMTPAYKVRSRYSMRIGNIASVSQCVVDNSGDVGPNSGGFFRIPLSGAKPDNWQFYGDMLGPNAIYVFGEITYFDTFNESHITEFRLAVTASENNPTIGTLTICDKGNRST